MACSKCSVPLAEHGACAGHVDACTSCGASDYQHAGVGCTECGGEVQPRPCRASPVRGAGVCVAHGGGAPQVRAAAALRLAEREARASLADVEVVPIGAAVDELLEQAAGAKAWMNHLGSLVAELSTDDYRRSSKEGAEHLDGRVQLLVQAMDAFHRRLVDIAKLNLDERRVRLDEIRIARVGLFVEFVLEAAGLDLQAPEIRRILDRALPILDGAPVPTIDVATMNPPKE